MYSLKCTCRFTKCKPACWGISRTNVASFGDVYTVISIKVVLPKVQTVNYERSKDSGLLLFLETYFFETTSRAHTKLTAANLLATKVYQGLN